MSTEAFFKPGRRGDSVRHADRLSLLIDGSDHFRDEMTMGVLRTRLRRLLTQADVRDRYRLMSPSVQEIETDCANVHNKLMVADDDLLLVGSANLNNRSMMLDAECVFRCARSVSSTCRSAVASRTARGTQTSITALRRGVLSQRIGGWRREKDGYRSSKCCKVLIPRPYRGPCLATSTSGLSTAGRCADRSRISIVLACQGPFQHATRCSPWTASGCIR